MEGTIGGRGQVEGQEQVAAADIPAENLFWPPDVLRNRRVTGVFHFKWENLCSIVD